MAINEVKLNSTLILKVKTGVDSSGNDILKSISLKKVKTNAVNQDVFDVAQGIKDVIKNQVVSITKQNVNELVSE